MKKIAFINTIESIVPVLDRHLYHVKSSYDFKHYTNQEIIDDVIKEGMVTNHGKNLIDSSIGKALHDRCELIFCTCSSISEYCSSLTLPIPILRIDEPMISEAVKIGKDITIIATVKGTIASTTNLLIKKAQGKEINIEQAYCKEAYTELLEGNIKQHDTLVKEVISALHKDSDVLLLAQASLSNIIKVDEHKKYKARILSSLTPGINMLVNYLGTNNS